MKSTKRSLFILVVAILALILVVLYRSNFEFEKKGERQITVITKSKYGENWDAIADGVRAAANEYGLDVKILAPDSERDVISQRYLLEMSRKSGTDAVIIAPIDYQMLLESLDLLEQYGIPVTTIVSKNEMLPEPQYIGEDSYAVGQKMAEQIVRQMGSSGDIVLFKLIDASQNNELRQKGIQDYLQDYPDIHIIIPEEDMTGQYNVIMNSTSLMREAPGIEVYVGLDEGSTAGICMAKETEKSSATIYGYGQNTDLYKYVENGLIKELVVPNSFAIGYIAFNNSLAILNHQSVDWNIYVEPIWVNAGNIVDENVQKVVFPVE